MNVENNLVCGVAKQGSTQRVLVPQLYALVDPDTPTLSAGLISAKGVKIDLTDGLFNSGTLAAHENLAINARGNMVFTGRGNASLQPGRDTSLTTALHGRIQTLDFFNRDKSAGGLIKLEQNTHQRNTDRFSTVAGAERHHQEWQYTDFSTPRRNSMTHLNFQHLAQAASAVLLGAALTACGGGSDGASDNADSSTTDANGVIVKQCAGDASSAQVTGAGCTVKLGASVDTLVCTGPNTVYRLGGTNHTRDAVLKSNNSYTAGGTITLEGVRIQCVV